MIGRIESSINIDLSRHYEVKVIHAVQGDQNSRCVSASIYNNGISWAIPTSVTDAFVTYSKPDGTGGSYSKLPDGTNACTWNGNIITAVFAPQVLTCPGAVTAGIKLTNNSGDVLQTFSFIISVEASADSSVISQDYWDQQKVDTLILYTGAVSSTKDEERNYAASLVLQTPHTGDLILGENLYTARVTQVSYSNGNIASLHAKATGTKFSIGIGSPLRVCSGLRATFGGQTIEGTGMPTVDGDVYEAVQLEVLGTDAAADGDIILGENGYFAVYGLEDGAATLTGTGTRLAWPSGGSGGALRVNVVRSANGTFTADKTFAEIKAAYDAGKVVEAAYTDNKSQNRCILPLTYCTTNTCIFSAYLATEEQGWKLVQLSCTDAGKWADFSGSIPAEDVQYQGNIGAAQAFSVAEALDGLAVGVPMDMSANYAASGAASVQAWATMAQAGDATEYRVAAGRYSISDADGEIGYLITIVDTPGTTCRTVWVASVTDGYAFVDCYTTDHTGGAVEHAVEFDAETNSLEINGHLVTLPAYTAADAGKNLTIGTDGTPRWEAAAALPTVGTADNGKFLRVVSGSWAAQALTNVAEVGA